MPELIITKCSAPYGRKESDWWRCMIGTCKFYRRGTQQQVEAYVTATIRQSQKRLSVQPNKWMMRQTLSIKMQVEHPEEKAK